MPAMVRGAKGTELAKILGLSAKTISAHNVRLMRKLAVSSTAEMVRYAIANVVATYGRDVGAKVPAKLCWL